MFMRRILVLVAVVALGLAAGWGIQKFRGYLAGKRPPAEKAAQPGPAPVSGVEHKEDTDPKKKESDEKAKEPRYCVGILQGLGRIQVVDSDGVIWDERNSRIQVERAGAWVDGVRLPLKASRYRPPTPSHCRQPATSPMRRPTNRRTP